MATVIGSLVVGLFLVLLIHRSIVSTRTFSLILDLSPGETAAEIEAQFPRVSWTSVHGPGTINKVHVHMMQRALIVSIDLRSYSEATRVTAWISNRNAYGWLVFSLGALKAAQLRARLRQHPAFIREADPE